MTSKQAQQPGEPNAVGGGGVATAAAAGVVDPESVVETPAGEATLLVSEFPPPPFYYTHAEGLTPPPIPVDALTRGTRRAAAAAARARAAEEKQRLAATGGEYDDTTDAILGGSKDDGDVEEETGDVVAVFGEIVEDPLLVEPLDHCEDPIAVCNEIRRLNHAVLQGFVRLVQDLVHRPIENKKTRDEMSYNIFLMLQECNKFREHQARELLIQLLEQQLAQRQKLVTELRDNIAKADALLGDE